ncbi:DNA-binding protein WhiA [Mycoplasma anserisalpingitidis]|uniref:DNA-binding protein WhiA n=1 Tax=Mycoplasma anserisalpingitidis TaxID=519450 RepID=UPI0011B0F836|nr:DNA-binding protein WhiA [Mycoplasma anserisalpingitidis]QDY87603.1 DNA-binding protein WhiA [Mycoplasma anserisalpingitidis]
MKKEFSFAQEIKLEIIDNQKLPKNIKSFIKGFIFSGAKIIDDEYVCIIRNKIYLEKIINLLKIIKIEFTVHNTKLSINKKYFKNESINYPSSYFAGVFFSSGSCFNKNSTSYHLEFSCYYEKNMNVLIEKLNSYDFDFHILNRNNKFTAYIKKIDKICEFLLAIEAKKAYFSLQDVKIERDLENTINRVNNIDFSNLTKVAKSSINHIKMINFIFENNLDGYFNQNQLVFFNIKLEHPELSLQNISEILENEYNIFISKGGLNHWINKLKSVYDNYK